MFTEYSDNNNIYEKYLFDTLPFIFIGNHKQLLEMNKIILNKSNNKTTNENLVFGQILKMKLLKQILI